MAFEPAFDPVRLEVMQNALGSVADEMILTVVRIAYSSIMKDTMDLVLELRRIRIPLTYDINWKKRAFRRDSLRSRSCALEIRPRVRPAQTLLIQPGRCA